jgi:glycosyltransferase involved in cell wall biosynthesis
VSGLAGRDRLNSGTGRISVVVPSYNSGATIRRTLQSLLNQNETPPAEIIVVDSSDDGRSARALEEFCREAIVRTPPIHIIHLAAKTMPAVARNVGARQASGPLLAFIDSDAYAAPDWIARIRDAAAHGLRIGGGSVRLPPDQRWRMIAVAQHFLQFNELLETGSRRAASFVASVNLFCEKALFDELGGFPEVRASEDVWFCHNAKRRVRVWFDPSVAVHHIFREDLRAYLANQRLLGRYTLNFLERTGPRVLYGGARPALLLPAFVLLKCLRIVSRVVRTADPAAMAGFLYALPLFIPGVIAWSAGFFQGWLEQRDPSSNDPRRLVC